jgi:hypothetical protein
LAALALGARGRDEVEWRREIAAQCVADEVDIVLLIGAKGDHDRTGSPRSTRCFSSSVTRHPRPNRKPRILPWRSAKRMESLEQSQASASASTLCAGVFWGGFFGRVTPSLQNLISIS